MKSFDKQELRANLDVFVKQSGRFPSRREFRALGSETLMYREFGGMSQLKNWYNVGASVSRLSKDKDFYLDVLRASVCIVKYEKDGADRHHALTLSPTILKPYVGKGTSKTAGSDIIFAYDTDAEVFRKVQVSKIKSCVPLT